MLHSSQLFLSCLSILISLTLSTISSVADYEKDKNPSFSEDLPFVSEWKSCIVSDSANRLNTLVPRGNAPILLRYVSINSF